MIDETNNIFPASRLTHLVSQVDVSPGLDKLFDYSVMTLPSSFM